MYNVYSSQPILFSTSGKACVKDDVITYTFANKLYENMKFETDVSSDK